MDARMLPDRLQDWMSRLSMPLDARSRKYVLPVLIGVWFAQGRRTASRWFQAAGVVDDWQDHYYFLGSLGRKTGRVATHLLQIALRWLPGLHVGPYVRIALALLLLAALVQFLLPAVRMLLTDRRQAS